MIASFLNLRAVCRFLGHVCTPFSGRGKAFAWLPAGLFSVAVLVTPLTFASLLYAADSGDKSREAESSLVSFEIIDNIHSKAIPKSLTGKKGNPKRGEVVMINRKLGNCLACHHLSRFDEKAKALPNKYGDMGEVGPPLDAVAERYDAGQLRLLLVDAKEVFPDTIMPAFYKVKGLHRVLPDYEGKPILEPQDIEDVLSFLLTLK